MLSYVMIELDEPRATPEEAARNVKSALVSRGDNSSSVFERRKNQVLVGVRESSDAIDEITERLNDAHVSCFVDETDEEASEDEEETVITDLTQND